MAGLNLDKEKVDMLRTQTFTIFSVPLLVIIVASRDPSARETRA
jgi:hypothetical protein